MKKSIIKLLVIPLIISSINGVNAHIQAQENKPQPPRPRPSFFEQERKPKFGFGDFVNSALDGVDNFFAADHNVKTLLANPNQLYNPLNPATLTVNSRDENSPNFLNIDLQGSGLNLTLGNPKYSGDPRVGTLDVLGGNAFPGATTIQYRGSFSTKGDLVTGSVQLFDPNNPNRTIFIHLDPTNIPNVNDENVPISAPVNFNLGLPTDR